MIKITKRKILHVSAVPIIEYTNDFLRRKDETPFAWQNRIRAHFEGRHTSPRAFRVAAAISFAGKRAMIQGAHSRKEVNESLRDCKDSRRLIGVWPPGKYLGGFDDRWRIVWEGLPDPIDDYSI